MNKQKGFTLIELIIVIVILGILSAVAIPRYLDLTTDAQLATAQGVVGALASASAMNNAVCQAGLSSCVATYTDCTTAAAALLEDGVPSGVTMSGTLPACTVTVGTQSATVNIVGGA